MCSCYGDSNEHSNILYSHVQIYLSVELEWSQEVPSSLNMEYGTAKYVPA